MCFLKSMVSTCHQFHLSGFRWAPNGKPKMTINKREKTTRDPFNQVEFNSRKSGTPDRVLMCSQNFYSKNSCTWAGWKGTEVWRGERCTYKGMQHEDAQPQSHWQLAKLGQWMKAMKEQPHCQMSQWADQLYRSVIVLALSQGRSYALQLLQKLPFRIDFLPCINPQVPLSRF